MKMLATLLISACMAVAAGGAAAQDATKKDAMAKKEMTMQECKDYMAMATKEAAKKDEKKDAVCAEMMKKDAAMKKEGTAAPAKK